MNKKDFVLSLIPALVTVVEGFGTQNKLHNALGHAHDFANELEEKGYFDPEPESTFEGQFRKVMSGEVNFPPEPEPVIWKSKKEKPSYDNCVWHADYSLDVACLEVKMPETSGVYVVNYVLGGSVIMISDTLYDWDDLPEGFRWRPVMEPKPEPEKVDGYDEMLQGMLVLAKSKQESSQVIENPYRLATMDERPDDGQRIEMRINNGNGFCDYKNVFCDYKNGYIFKDGFKYRSWVVYVEGGWEWRPATEDTKHE